MQAASNLAGTVRGHVRLGAAQPAREPSQCYHHAISSQTAVDVPVQRPAAVRRHAEFFEQGGRDCR